MVIVQVHEHSGQQSPKENFDTAGEVTTPNDEVIEVVILSVDQRNTGCYSILSTIGRSSEVQDREGVFVQQETEGGKWVGNSDSLGLNAFKILEAMRFRT
jgi:hypothetical protein